MDKASKWTFRAKKTNDKRSHVLCGYLMQSRENWSLYDYHCWDFEEKVFLESSGKPSEEINVKLKVKGCVWTIFRDAPTHPLMQFLGKIWCAVKLLSTSTLQSICICIMLKNKLQQRHPAMNISRALTRNPYVAGNLASVTELCRAPDSDMH